MPYNQNKWHKTNILAYTLLFVEIGVDIASMANMAFIC
jgi:hypothetical protein